MEAGAHSNRELPVDATLRRIVALLRAMGWAWMLMLVILTLVDDPDANRTIVIGALALATVWTVVTLWAAQPTGPLGAGWFDTIDLGVALLVGLASTAAGAADLFHGGYPMSALGVLAFGGGLRLTLIGGTILGIEQVTVHLLDGRGPLPTAGSVTFVVFGILMGWGFDAVRRQERARIALEAELDAAREAQVRQDERIALANRLHDSVLQTLAVLRRNADDPDHVRFLARRQERRLRQTISEYRSPYATSARAALQAVCDEVEDVHRVEIDTVVRGDADVGDPCTVALAATREALTNAAKHAGVEVIDLYAELAPARLEIFVRDRGRGFDVAAADQVGGMDHSVRRRMADAGGVAIIRSRPGDGTEVHLRWPAP